MKALILDVDGVLTDGGIILDATDGESKRFHARDGVGIKLAQVAGWRVLFLTARISPAAERRAQELNAECSAGVSRKAHFLTRWLEAADISPEDTAFVGDDLQDLEAMGAVGWPIAVADAAAEVQAAARYVTRLGGGAGAVREAVEWLLDQENRREEVVSGFVRGQEGFVVGGSEDQKDD